MPESPTKVLLCKNEKLNGFSAYTHAIRRCAQHFDHCPDKRLTNGELTQYFSDLLNTHSWSTIRRDPDGLQRYFELILQHQQDWVTIIKPLSVKTLPDILLAKEMNR